MSVASREQIRVLHVDDEPGFTDLAATFLERESDRFAVETATSADAGLERIGDCEPDCVVSDYNMPGTDGLEFLQTVRETYPDLPFILYTGKGSEAVASEAIDADVTDYLQKGSGSEQYELLANRVRNAVQARRDAERATRQEELMRLTEFAGDTGGFEMDRENDSVLLTAGTRRIAGVPGRSEITLQEAVELFHPDDQADIQRRLATAFETGEELHDAWRLQPNGGDERLIELTMIPVLEDGEVTKLRGAGLDITDRERRKEKLDSERRFVQQAIDTLGDLVYVINPDGSLRRGNEQALDITGCTGSELADVDAVELFPEDERVTVADAIGTALTDGRAEVEADILTAGGERIPHEFRTARLEDGDDNTTGLVGVGHDISARKESEAAVDWHRTVIQSMEAGVYVLDADCEFQFVSYRTDAVEGLSEHDWVGRQLSYLAEIGTLSTGEVETIRSGVDRLVAGEAETVAIEVEPEQPESTAVAELKLEQLDVGTGEKLVLATTCDVTEHRRREQEMLDLKRQYQTLAENLPNGAVFLFDTDRRYVRARGTELEAVGLSPDDIEGATPGEIFPEDVAAELAGFYEAALNGTSNTFTQQLGGDRYQIWTVPVRSGDGDVACGMALSQNITDQTERRRALERQNERLEEFASIVSHDLRNPLGVAKGHTELALENTESEHLRESIDAIERSQALIDDLLTLAQEGDRVDETEPVDLADAAESGWQTTETARATLDVDRPPVVEADQGRLQQLLENLYRNAVEHGGEDVAVAVGATDGGFYVADTGPGIPESDREDIFQAGYSTSDDGTGFGLRIVEQVADAHGWAVETTKSEQGGARFEVTGVEFAGR